MLGGDIGLHTKRIEIYENERYSPLSGWSPKALLLTDRKALSNHDGSEGYNTIEEASQALISFGWQWDEAPWSIDKSPTINGATDEEGWTYSSDFTSFSSEHQEKTNISGTKGIMHFVRRRKLARNQSFDVNLICNVVDFTCDHCDLKESEKLSTLFLEKFTQATVKRHPRSLSLAKANALKNAFVIALQLSDHDLIEKTEPSAATPRSGSMSFFRRSQSMSGTPTANAVPVAEQVPATSLKEEATSPVAAATANEQTEDVEGTPRLTSVSSLNPSTLASLLNKFTVTSYSYERIVELLDAFIQSSSSALSMASSIIATNKNTSEYQEQRINEVNRLYFTKEERLALGRLLLRKYDIVYTYHCNQKNCGQLCDFRIEQCVNTNCFVQYSHKWFSEHDAICPEKILPCERTCGEEILRKNMTTHLTHTCELRPVVCPYQCIGCSIEGLVARTLPHHIDTSTQSHMENLLHRMLEQQQVISAVYGKINDLETVNKTHWQEILAVQSSIAAASIALKASESRHDKHMTDAIKNLDNKINRVDSNLRHEIRNEIGKLGILFASKNHSNLGIPIELHDF